MSQMNKTLRPLRVATTRDSHLIITILCWQAIALHLHLKERLLLSRKWAGQYLTPDSASSTTSNQEHSDVLMPDQAWIALKREVTRPTVESDEPILPSPGTHRQYQSSPTDSINNITCVSDNFQKLLDTLSPYQLENLASLVNGDLALL